MQTLDIDQLVGRYLGEYQIEQRLGRGELSTVYIARQPAQGQKVMVIVFNPPEGVSVREQQQFTLRFAQEGAALVKLKHPHILPTYDFGELSGHPYLVTALVKGVSLNQLRRQQERFTPQHTLAILKQMASALDYAHGSGVVHGSLSISNILINQDSTVQIINFGIRMAFEANRRMQHEQPVDAHSDIYALGSILYELLSGTTPFDGTNLSNTVSKHFLQPVSSIHARCPDVPEALDLVIEKILEQDPSRGYQHASDIVFAFEHALKTVDATSAGKYQDTRQLFQDTQITLPPTVNWFEEASIFSSKGEKMEEWGQGPSQKYGPTGNTSFSVPISESLTAVRPGRDEGFPPGESSPDTRSGIETLNSWSVTNVGPDTEGSLPGTFKRSAASPGTFSPYSQRPVQQNRRKIVALIAAGTVATTAFALGGMSFLQHMQQSSGQFANVPANANNTIGTTNTLSNSKTPNAQSTKGPQNTATASATSQAQSTPTQASQAQPTPTQGTQAQPTPTSPPPPSHTGTVIGSTSQAANSAKSFTNPADGQAALLVHLANGNFVAGETACTHQGVPVTYNAGTQKFDCPAHGAIFDPANGFSYVGGFSRALSALPSVAVRVNNDGTITTG